MNPGHGLYPAMTVGEIVEVDIELESLGHAITAIWIGHPDARPVDRGSGSWFPDTHFGSSRASESLFLPCSTCRQIRDMSGSSSQTALFDVNS